MTDPQVPRMPDLMVYAVEGVAAGLDDRAREARIRHANHGVFSQILKGWEGQGISARARQTREIIASRNFDSNTGQPLRDLAASEYFASLADEPQYAIGEFQVWRFVTNTSSGTTGNFLPGVARAGTRVNRPQVIGGDVTVADASYVTTADVVATGDDNFPVGDLGDGKYQHSQYLTLPIRASRAGIAANTPILCAGELSDQLFDAAQPVATRFKSGSLYSAGGAVGTVDEQVRALCRAMAIGRFGANNAAALAGALTDPRVRRVAAALSYSTAVLWLYIADASWSTSAALRNDVLLQLRQNKWLGFGARVAMGEVYNQRVTVKATIVLRGAVERAALDAIKSAIQQALQTYFDDRRDWYTWRLDAIGGVIARADKRVITCQDPLVLSEGSPLAQPSAQITAGNDIPHYLLTGVDLAFITPGGAP